MEEDSPPKLYTGSEVAEVIVQPVVILGHGGCGEVYKGVVGPRKDGEQQQWVAVKTFHTTLTTESGSDEDLQALMKEVELAKAHPHVVQVLGYCKQPPALVSEFMAGGDLQKVLDQPEILS